MYAWMKTDPSGGQDPTAGTGGRNPPAWIGFDWYGPGGFIAAVFSNGPEELSGIVPGVTTSGSGPAGILWDTDWTLLKVEVDVPAIVHSWDGYDVVPTGIYPYASRQFGGNIGFGDSGNV